MNDLNSNSEHDKEFSKIATYLNNAYFLSEKANAHMLSYLIKMALEEFRILSLEKTGKTTL
jgi:hypothetical protein